MRALVWILIWVVLVVGGAGYLWTKARVAWRKSRDLGGELRMTEQRLGEVRHQVERLREGTDAVSELAVFGDASALRKERLATRRTLADQQRERRAKDIPAWARRVDS